MRQNFVSVSARSSKRRLPFLKNIDAFVLKLLGPCSPDDPPEMKGGYLGNLSHRATMAEVCLDCCQFMLFMLNESDDNQVKRLVIVRRFGRAMACLGMKPRYAVFNLDGSLFE